MWKRTVACKVIDSSINHIDVHIMEELNASWRLTYYYGFPERDRRHEAWNFLRGLVKFDSVPWCIFGDFNDMMCSTDKTGPHPHPQPLLDGFKSAIDDCGLLEIDLKGGDFTWEKNKSKPNWVREKLDRSFAKLLGEGSFLCISRKQFRFRFENTWLQEPSFKEEVTQFWKEIPKIHLLPKLLSVSSFMARWGRTFFHKFRDKIKKQKVVLLDNHDEMGRVVLDYFRGVFNGDSSTSMQPNSEEAVVITEEQNAKLTGEIKFMEFTTALKQMHPDKSAGPHGFSPAFSQHFWDLVGEDVFKCCKEWLTECTFPAHINDTTLVLIPKKENADRMADLRPIALCNVLYKILAKVLANRLKSIPPGVITENQSTFVLGRYISDNVLVTFEILHFMKRKNRGQEGEVALKLDISKAYDRVDWNYLKSRMEVSHLLFADDSFLFFKASREEAGVVKMLLNAYGRESGQVVNYHKSAIFFSANVRMDKKQEIKDILGVQNDLGDNKYLGLPSLIGRSKKSVFGFVKDRVWRKIQDWTNQMISKVGKLIMIKNVAQTIPSYIMSCFLLPKSLCTGIEKLMNGYWWGSSGGNSRGIKWMAWNRLAVAKSKGGLGVRDLHGQNLSLLGKHIWNFSRKPDTLVTRIFKKRYFPDRHIMQASRGTDPSFIWTGIWEAKERLKGGFRWVLGDGKEISICKDRWFQGKVDFRVEDNHMNIIRYEKVCSYFHPNSKVWDVQKVERDFHAEDSKLILQTRIPQIEVANRLAWTGSHKGIYTVKTGYRFWEASNVNRDNMIESQGWTKLWNLQLPHKTKVFLWRFCRNNIPVRKLLRSKGVVITIMCPMCGVDIEHLRHLFCECPFAVECWSKSALNVDMQDIESASTWLLDTIRRENADTVQNMVVVLSGIWFVRNKKVWESKDLTPTITMALSTKMVQEWEEANKCRSRSSHRQSDLATDEQVKWQPPEVLFYKLNVDASLYSGEFMFSLGLVVRDANGHFIVGKNMRFAGERSVMEAETLGVYEAINWVLSTGLHHVVIETDSQLVVHALNSKDSYQVEVGHIIDECKERIKDRGDLSVHFVKKQANKATHLLARAPCLLNTYNHFIFPPDLLLEILSSDFPS
ncbi:hypothetical protein AgCh_006337 [Apium graveolens]